MREAEPGLPQLDAGSVVTVGTFDGVHRGHSDILERVVARGRSMGLPTVLVTFLPHPVAVLNPGAAPPLLTPDQEQREALAATGIEHVIVLPFTATLAQYSAAAFVERLLCERYRMQALVVGYNHRLGRGREGDATVLAALGQRVGFHVDVVPPALDATGAPVSSSGIRRAIADGSLEAAAAALGRRYALCGVVQQGSQRGRELGYPTLNVAIPPRKLLPPDGVYAVRAETPRGQFGGMMNLGGRPTFGDFNRSIEVHLFEASGDWYGVSVAVELVRQLRETARFPSVEALVAQLARDAQDARVALTQA